MGQNKRQIDLEQLTEDMIRFLQTWGLWEDTVILTKGNKYAYTKDGNETFRNLRHVKVMEGIDPEKMMKGCTEEDDCQGRPIWRSYANPEHVFDMVFEGPLCALLGYEVYEPVKADIGEEAWNTIFQNDTDNSIMRDFLHKKYGCADAEEYLEKIQKEELDYSEWDPLEFDTWDEYLEFIGYQEPGESENIKRFRTYAEYEDYCELYCQTGVSDVEPIWELMVEDARKEFIKDFKRNERERICIPGMTSIVLHKLRNLLEGYGLYYNTCFTWSATCFRSQIKFFCIFASASLRSLHRLVSFVEVFEITNFLVPSNTYFLNAMLIPPLPCFTIIKTFQEILLQGLRPGLFYLQT